MTYYVAVSVPLTDRQKRALRDYSGALGMSMSAYVRDLISESIPPEYWTREPTPPGQLTIEEET